MAESSRERARDTVKTAGGPELLERLDHLDALRSRGRGPSASPPRLVAPHDAIDTDVIIAGGGLWSLLAPILAARGLRVTVVERARVGAAHREWNASRSELMSLVDRGILRNEAELDALVVATYDWGTCRFHGGGDYPVPNVLDHAIDAGPLLQHARASAEARGVDMRDGCSVLSHSANEHGVRVRIASGSSEIELTAKALVDARGVSSPFASADLVCPTVGGVMRGLRAGEGVREMNPKVGEILATVDGIDDTGRQHVWEAFPGRDGETTVYLFYYGRAGEPHDLASLFARFFECLPTYKEGNAQLVRPTFGLIPGWSRLGPAPRAPDPRVLLVGDAAARHSPLTYCGFGAALRSFGPCADAIAGIVEGAPQVGVAMHDAPVHRLTGALAYMMASRSMRGQELNALLDDAFSTLHYLGDETYASLLQDTMTTRDFVRFLKGTAARHPSVWGEALRGMGAKTIGRLAAGLARSWVMRDG